VINIVLTKKQCSAKKAIHYKWRILQQQNQYNFQYLP